MPYISTIEFNQVNEAQHVTSNTKAGTKPLSNQSKTSSGNQYHTNYTHLNSFGVILPLTSSKTNLLNNAKQYMLTCISKHENDDMPYMHTQSTLNKYILTLSICTHSGHL